MTDKNIMGSRVIEGCNCKPQVLDKDKPIMFSATQIFLCDGKRCQETASEDLANKLRKLIKELELDKGEQRVKVTRTYCNGACRFTQFSYTYKKAKSPNFTTENSFTACEKSSQVVR